MLHPLTFVFCSTSNAKSFVRVCQYPSVSQFPVGLACLHQWFAQEPDATFASRREASARSSLTQMRMARI